MTKLLLLSLFFIFGSCASTEPFRIVKEVHSTPVPQSKIQKHHVVPRGTLEKVFEMLSNANNFRFNSLLSNYFEGVDDFTVVSKEQFSYMNINLYDGPRRSNRYNDPATEGRNIERPLLAVPYFAVDSWPKSVRKQYPISVQKMEELWIAVESSLILYLSCYENPKYEIFGGPQRISNRSLTIFGEYSDKMKEFDEIEKLFIALENAFRSWKDEGKIMNFRWEDSFPYSESDWITISKGMWSLNHEGEMVEPEMESGFQLAPFEYVELSKRDNAIPKEGYTLYNDDWEVYPGGYYPDNLKKLRRKDGIRFKQHSIRQCFRKYQLLRLLQIGLVTGIKGYARQRLLALLEIHLGGIDELKQDVSTINVDALDTAVNRAAYELGMVFQFVNLTPHQYCDADQLNDVVWHKEEVPRQELTNASSTGIALDESNSSTLYSTTHTTADDGNHTKLNTSKEKKAKKKQKTLSLKGSSSPKPEVQQQQAAATALQPDPALQKALAIKNHEHKAKRQKQKRRRPKLGQTNAMKSLLQRSKPTREQYNKYTDSIKTEFRKPLDFSFEFHLIERRINRQLAYVNDITEDTFSTAADEIFVKSIQLSLFYLLCREYDSRMQAGKFNIFRKNFKEMGGNVTRKSEDNQGWQLMMDMFDEITGDFEQMMKSIHQVTTEYLEIRKIRTHESWREIRDKAKKVALTLRQFFTLTQTSGSLRVELQATWVSQTKFFAGNPKAGIIYATRWIDNLTRAYAGVDKFEDVVGKRLRVIHRESHPISGTDIDFFFNFLCDEPIFGTEETMALNSSAFVLAHGIFMKYDEDAYEAAAKSLESPFRLMNAHDEEKMKREFGTRLNIIEDWQRELLPFQKISKYPSIIGSNRIALKDENGMEYHGMYSVVRSSGESNDIRYFNCETPEKSFISKKGVIKELHTTESEQLLIQNACKSLSIQHSIKLKSGKKKHGNVTFKYSFLESFDNVINRIQTKAKFTKEIKEKLIYTYRRDKAFHDTWYGMMNNVQGSKFLKFHTDKPESDVEDSDKKVLTLGNSKNKMPIFGDLYVCGGLAIDDVLLEPEPEPFVSPTEEIDTTYLTHIIYLIPIFAIIFSIYSLLIKP